MAEIDSGLGWSVDEAFFVNTADEGIASQMGLKSFKTNGGAAIIAGFYSTSGMSDCAEFALISTEKENTYFYDSPGAAGYLASRYLGTYEVNGVEWHAAVVGQLGGSHFATGTPYVSTERQLSENVGINYETFTAETIVSLFFRNISIETKTAKKIPSVNYVHEYVEGVLKNIPTITNAQIDNLF